MALFTRTMKGKYLLYPNHSSNGQFRRTFNILRIESSRHSLHVQCWWQCISSSRTISGTIIIEKTTGCFRICITIFMNNLHYYILRTYYLLRTHIHIKCDAYSKVSGCSIRFSVRAVLEIVLQLLMYCHQPVHTRNEEHCSLEEKKIFFYTKFTCIWGK